MWQRALADKRLRLNVKKTKFISSEQGAGSILDCQGKRYGQGTDKRSLAQVDGVHRDPLRQ
ncbi:unnamed protein product [Heligmosomoides polygyrus]|uniref:Reverse transcriptase domain-containing protein n=1 Tax=Heligmosomoides polygyrus TaxID=6339 RepID=A0A3P7X3A8_HELPZ|nr:unnamed protein product [Heligmosomoides polygyrus]